jgi:hypothetical protein
MTNEIFPELDSEQWKTAHESASPHGLQGLTRALHLTTTAIANTRSEIGTHVFNLKNEIKTLNSKLEEFNNSSANLTQKAIRLTKWIMVATIVSALAMAILAIDIVVKWL